MKVDPNILKSIFPIFGVLPLSHLKGAKEAIASGQMEKAQAQHEPILTGNDFEWNDDSHAYHKDNQIVYSFPNKIYLWVVNGEMGRVLQGSEKLKKWLQGDEKYPEGKVNSFIQKYGELIGEPSTGTPTDKPGKPNPMDRGEPGDIKMDPMKGPPPSRLVAAPAKSEVDNIIQKIQAKAKVDTTAKLSKQPPIRLPADDIIDLYKKAKEIEQTNPTDGQKLVDFIKTLHILEEGKILASDFEALVRGVVRGIVNEIAEAKKKKKNKLPQYRPDVEGQYVYDPDKGTFAPPKGEHPPDDDPNLGMNWPVPMMASKERPPKHSQMDWEPSSEKSKNKSQGPDYEKWLEDVANKLWKDPLDIGHNYQGWRVSRVVPQKDGAVYLLTLKKEWHDSRVFYNRNGKWYWINPTEQGKSWKPLEEIPPDEEPSIEQEQSTTGAVAPVTGPNAFKKQNKPMEMEKIEETSTSDGAGPYNVPGWVSRRGGSKAGVDGSRKLGYELTPIGKKDMELKGDKLFEGVALLKDKTICYYCHKPLDSVGAIACSYCKKVQPNITPVPGERSYEKRFPSRKTSDVSPLQQESEQGLEGYKGPDCPHCNMMTVNGMATHETGCPAVKRRKKPNCPHCGNEVELGQTKCSHCLKPVKESAMGGLGSKFMSAARAYDAQSPPEDPDPIQCDKCGGDAYITKQGRKKGYWWWEATCKQCGNKMGDDNF